MTKEDFYEELKRDAEAAARQEYNEDIALYKDFSKFLDKFEEEIDEAVEACRVVKRLFESYDYEFDISEIGDLL